MKKISKLLLTLTILITFISSTIVVYAVPEPPSGSRPGSGGPSGGSTSVSFSGASTLTSDETLENQTYSSTQSAQNALLVSSGTSTLNNPTVTKSGDTSDENSDFYGTNAAILVYNGATLNINGGTVTTNASHANGVFSYSNGTINIEKTNIKTTGNNSGGIMVTGGGVLNAKNLNVETDGNSSASIRSDRGGGTLTVDGGTYKTNGKGSPAIYSTADITVNNAELISTSSEGAVVEGANKITLNKVNLTDTNNSLNGQSSTYKNIFLYQSMSGDADVGTSYFTAKDSNITTNKGDTIYVTNTNSVITLENNKIVNNDGDFLRAEAAAWGTSGSNGGKVTLNLSNQTVEGNIIVDNISALNMKLDSKSIYKGTINNSNTSNNITLTLDNDSIVILTGDSYINSLSNSKSDNSNIYLNGFSLYVNNEKISANDGEIPNIEETNVEETKVVNTNKDDDNIIKYIIIGAVIGAVAGLIVSIIIIVIKKKKGKASE